MCLHKCNLYVHKRERKGNATVNTDDELIKKFIFGTFVYSTFSTMIKETLGQCLKFYFTPYSILFGNLHNLYFSFKMRTLILASYICF